MSPASAVAPPAAQLRTGVFEVAMAPDPARVAQIRRITVAHMRLWAVPATLAEDVRLVVSELVTNAVEHGHGTVSLRMRHTGSHLHIEVTDANPTPAQLCAAADDDVCGRGLFLVDALSGNWGVSNGGTTTWATFHVPEGGV
ncbi:ATP-binding protein [Streptomyces sp. 35G-GA-8]|uniref:ATP-binding protein n=1 Tax=Streptomyces sp. 35G-GA-8 TaxID=2939434 RepID=UPI00201F3344|nr:ATP-binding protein [Streptomyces sp. 35G-GA-8]MCL7381275.1 ATP-binding protein [Streptomyces sp. 35G-GA-8]